MRGAALARAVEREEQPHARIGEQVEVAMEIAEVAAMADDRLAVAVLVVEAERHRRHARDRHVGGRLHPRLGRR